MLKNYQLILLKKIRKKLSSEFNWNNFIQNTLSLIINPYLKIINKSKNPNSYQSEFYNCDKDKIKSNRIANHLINNWYIAYLISKNNQSEFIGILQPSVFSSNVNYDYFNESEKNKILLYKDQVESVYKEIIFEIDKVCLKDKLFCKSLINGTGWLANKENIFGSFPR